MALQSSGQITLANISDEFGGGSRSNVSLRALSSTAGLSQPDQFSDFYGLSAFTPPTYISGAHSISGSGTPSSPWVIRTVDSQYSKYYEYSDYYGAGGADFATGPYVYFRAQTAGSYTFYARWQSLSLGNLQFNTEVNTSRTVPNYQTYPPSTNTVSRTLNLNVNSSFGVQHEFIHEDFGPADGTITGINAYYRFWYVFNG